MSNDRHGSLDDPGRDDYLWLAAGPIDPEIEQLERTLAPLRPAVPTPPPWLLRAAGADDILHWRAPERMASALLGPGEATAPVATRPLPTRRRALPLLAGLGLGAAAAAALLRVTRPFAPTLPGSDARPVPPPPGPTANASARGWPIEVTAGQPLMAGRRLQGTSTFLPGTTLSTPLGARARLSVPDLGAVEVASGTTVELLDGAGRLRLLRGHLRVFIWAPPGRFFVETPAGLAVDLGCAYTVTVDERGDGVLAVSTGWVGFVQGGRESLVPAGAACALRVGQGPGTPYHLDAPAALRAAVARRDRPADAADEARALRTILASARRQDAMTLWHLLARVEPAQRPAVLARLHQLVPATARVPAARVLAGERAAHDRLWDALGLEPIAHWRLWQARPTR